MRFWPRSSPEGHREVSEEEARRIERQGRRPEPQGPTGVKSSGWYYDGPNGERFGGPTGPVPMIEHVESKGKPDEIRTGYGTTTSLGSTGGVPRFVGFRDGEWYAFRLYRLVDDEQARDRRIAELDARRLGFPRYPGKPLRDGLPLDNAVSGVDVVEFYAIATADPSTGFLELREIPDPWVCAVCEKSYQEGAHTEFGFDGPDAHYYTARGAPSC